MQSYHDRLLAEIAECVNSLIAHRAVLDHGKVALDICSRHEAVLPPEGEDRDFWTWTGYRYVHDETRRYINKRTEQDEHADRQQINLPGFDREHLQDYYAVERNGRAVHVPVVELTDEELEAKAQEKEKRAQTELKHADELRRFMVWRRTATQGAK